MAPRAKVVIPKQVGRAMWMTAQRLNSRTPFGAGSAAAQAAIEQLGYVQIDTINVIERSHHHILFSRIPEYRRSDLGQLQSQAKSIFEYWTHALSYVPVRDYPFYAAQMQAYRSTPSRWYASVSSADIKAMIRRLEAEGPLSMRDIDGDVLVEKTHLWGSRKPSKLVLQLMFYQGLVSISERVGMLKTYELTQRHFGWEAPPRRATPKQRINYLLDRALRSQGLISLASTCHLNTKDKPAIAEAIEGRVARGKLVPIALEGAENVPHWATPEALEATGDVQENLIHILSPFDPLIIQRKRLEMFFGYAHVFEAYVPADKRRYGYFALPVLMGDRVVAVADLKTDRAAKQLKVQNFIWLEPESSETKAAVDAELSRFERFQLAN